MAQIFYVLRKIYRHDKPFQKFYPVETNCDECWSKGLLCYL